jgi:hypothetical protein
VLYAREAVVYLLYAGWGCCKAPLKGHCCCGCWGCCKAILLFEASAASVWKGFMPHNTQLQHYCMTLYAAVTSVSFFRRQATGRAKQLLQRHAFGFTSQAMSRVEERARLGALVLGMSSAPVLAWRRRVQLLCVATHCTGHMLL